MSRAVLIADTHAHLYPCYDLRRAGHACFKHLQALAASVPRGSQTLYALFLTERADCHFFRALKEGRVSLGEELDIRSSGDENALICAHPEGMEFLIIAGRQIATRERLEAAALAVDAKIPEGLPLEETLAAIRNAGAIPVLNWAAGKWLGGRGRRLRELLEKSEPGSFCLGDSSLRPWPSPPPGLFQRARERGFHTLAGSDPLPFAGEERKLACYGVSMEFEWTPCQPLASIRNALAASSTVIQTAGRRDGWFEAGRRLLALRSAARKERSSHG